MITYTIEDVQIGDRFEVMPPEAGDNGGNN
jgi:hypothetical protein